MSNSNIPQTPEAVAFQLMEKIFKVEGKVTETSVNDGQSVKIRYASRQDILNTYKECLNTVKNITAKAID